jgi:hypothetical protein
MSYVRNIEWGHMRRIEDLGDEECKEKMAAVLSLSS